MTDISEVTAGKYELTVERWDQITSKPGQPFDFTRHRRGDVIDLDVEQARRLVRAGAVKPAGEATPEPEESAPGTIPAVLAEVGEDPEKALAALEAEKASDKPRATLIGKLEAIVEKATDGAS